MRSPCPPAMSLVPRSAAEPPLRPRPPSTAASTSILGGPGAGAAGFRQSPHSTLTATSALVATATTEPICPSCPAGDTAVESGHVGAGVDDGLPRRRRRASATTPYSVPTAPCGTAALNDFITECGCGIVWSVAANSQQISSALDRRPRA